MASASVRKALQDTIIDIVTIAAAGRVAYFDTKLEDREFQPNEFPMVAVNVRSKDQTGPGEFGTLKELWGWTVHIYYLDIADDYATGEEKRDKVIDDIETALELNPRLNNLAVPYANGQLERVYDSNFTSILFDSSGQQGYYSFTSELYLNVDTQR